jgi:hypothetical protein
MKQALELNKYGDILRLLDGTYLVLCFGRFGA